MSIQNAITFISNVDTSLELRTACYSCHSQQELLEMLKAQDLDFTPDEFADAINGLLLKCQTYDQAGRVKEVQAWFSMFR
jgi:Nif11 domain